MTRTVIAALGAAVLLGSATGARALTLLSPPLRAPSGGSFGCVIFNHSPTKVMAASIKLLDEQGDEVTSTEVICNGRNGRFCFRNAADADARDRALVCRFDVTGVGRSEARAAVRVFDASFEQSTTLEAR
jgi:hypothetical protein